MAILITESTLRHGGMVQLFLDNISIPVFPPNLQRVDIERLTYIYYMRSLVRIVQLTRRGLCKTAEPQKELYEARLWMSTFYLSSYLAKLPFSFILLFLR